MDNKIRKNHERGFTVAELAVSLLVTIVLILGVLALFDFSNRLSRVQTNVADMQQSLRVSLQDTVRMVRMAGRGGLPLGAVPSGIALSVTDNVPANTRIAGGSTPLVLPGTDVITVRGVFRNPIWQVNSANPASFNLSPAGAPVRGTVQIATTTPTGIPQDLSALRALVLNPTPVPEALVLVSPRDATVYAVVELDPATSDVGNPNLYTIGFRITGGSNTASYLPLSRGGGWPLDLTNVAFVGILEEFRYYVRNDPAGPRLARAQAFPGTQKPWRNDNDLGGTPNDAHPSWSQDIADNILDLQIALGFDTPQGGGAMSDDENGTGNDDRIFEAANGQNDDWLFNDTQAVNAATWNGPPLYFVRFSVLARTDRRDPQYQAPLLAWVEDHDLTASAHNQRTERMYRRRVLETLIDMRNLG